MSGQEIGSAERQAKVDPCPFCKAECMVIDSIPSSDEQNGEINLEGDHAEHCPAHETQSGGGVRFFYDLESIHEADQFIRLLNHQTGRGIEQLEWEPVPEIQ